MYYSRVDLLPSKMVGNKLLWNINDMSEMKNYERKIISVASSYMRPHKVVISLILINISLKHSDNE